MSKKDYKVPPKKIPKKLLDQVTMGGEVEVEDKYLDNAGSIATKIQAELDYLKSKGATPEQLKSLE